MVKHSKLFGFITVSVSVVIIFFVLLSMWISALTVGIPNHGPRENEVIMEVAVNSTSPLILSISMKSFYYADIKFGHGHIKDSNQTIVAQCPRTESVGLVWDAGGHSVEGFAVCVLPAGSEKTLTLNLNTTLPSGNYTLWLFGGYPSCAFVSPYFTMP
jgi:hypothetical protein